MQVCIVQAFKVKMEEGVSGESLTVRWSRLRSAGLYSTLFYMAFVPQRSVVRSTIVSSPSINRRMGAQSCSGVQVQ